MYEKNLTILLFFLGNTSLVECKTTSVPSSTGTVKKKKKRTRLTKEEERRRKDRQIIFGYIALFALLSTIFYGLTGGNLESVKKNNLENNKVDASTSSPVGYYDQGRSSLPFVQNNVFGDYQKSIPPLTPSEPESLWEAIEDNRSSSPLPFVQDNVFEELPKVVEKFNPYKEENPYKVFEIDWANSTLDPETIEYLKKDIPNVSINIEHGRRAWPFFVAAKLLNTQIYTKDEWIRLFYKKSKVFESLSDDDFLKEFNQSLEEPYYFHATKRIEIALAILFSEEISITGESHPGAFVAPKNPETSYGRFIFSFKRSIEFFSFPISYNNIWVGFWKPIPLKEHLCEIFIDTDEGVNKRISDQEFKTYKEKIEKVLQSKGYDPHIKVGRLSSLAERRKKRDPTRNLHAGSVIPIWFNLGGFFSFQRNDRNELEPSNSFYFRELYSEKELQIKKFKRF